MTFKLQCRWVRKREPVGDETKMSDKFRLETF